MVLVVVQEAHSGEKHSGDRTDGVVRGREESGGSLQQQTVTGGPGTVLRAMALVPHLALIAALRCRVRHSYATDEKTEGKAVKCWPAQGHSCQWETMTQSV